MNKNKSKQGFLRGALTAVALMSLSPSASAVWINEFHYDNSGADTGEFVEIAGLAGTDLSTYSLVFYNGSDGTIVTPIFALIGLIDDEGVGYGAVSFNRSSIQNDMEGIALVQSGVVVQFLSYEGSFSATSGAAATMTSVNIGVDEDPAPATGNSLQLVGTFGAFAWSGPSAASAGRLNAGQTFPSIGTGPTNGVPDAGATAALLGLSLSGLGFFARRRS